MTSRRTAKRPGRPSITGAGAVCVTTKFERSQMVKINRLAGPTPGGRAVAIRQLVDAGIAATFRR
jgi:hypothetical protein